MDIAHISHIGAWFNFRVVGWWVGGGLDIISGLRWVWGGFGGGGGGVVVVIQSWGLAANWWWWVVGWWVGDQVYRGVYSCQRVILAPGCS